MGIYESLVYHRLNLTGPRYLVYAGAFAIPLLIQLIFLAVALVIHRRETLVKRHFKQFPTTVILSYLAAFTVSYRCVKVLYHRSSTRFDMRVLREDPKGGPAWKNLRVLNLWFSYSTLFGDAALIAAAISVLQ